MERKQLRLKQWDYSNNGAYFITICTDKRKKILSHIVGDGFPVLNLILSQCGKIVDKYINVINTKYPMVKIDKYVIMPNHIHMILILNKENGTGNPSPTIGNIMGWLKYNITKQINEYYKTQGIKIFQRSYYNHILRNQQDYEDAWNYIDGNPSKWQDDEYH